MAEALGIDRSTVRRWEAGENEPSAYVRPDLAERLGLSRAELAALLTAEPSAPDAGERTPAELVSAVLSPLAPPPPPRRPAVPPTVHSELLTQYEQLANSYRQLDYQIGSGAVYAETVAQLGRLLSVADSVPSTLYQRFAALLGDTAQLAAWLAIDHQDYQAGRHYASLALSSAQECEDPTMHAYVIGIMSYVHLHAKRGPDAMRLLLGALRIAETPKFGVNQAVHSWLLEAIGEAYGLAGDQQAGARALAKSEQLFDGVNPCDVPGWLGFFNSPEHITRLKGRCLLRLGETRAAITTLEEAVATLPAHYVREQSGTMIDLAAAHLTPGRSVDADAAASTALKAWELAVQTDSRRNQVRIRELTPRFGPYRHVGAVGSLLEAVT